MIYTSDSIEQLADMFASLPTIGRKTARRLAFHVLKQPREFSEKFASALIELKDKVKFCSTCFNYTESDPCPICSSEKRNTRVICVVEEPTDVFAVERTHDYFGLYHVLHGIINPLEGITQNDIKIRELVERSVECEEVILALNPSAEGEVTSLYIAKLLKPLNVKVSKIASGIPIGSSLEFSDEATLSKAIEGRISL